MAFEVVETERAMTALNIRGLSEEVVRNFRVQAARLGLTHPQYLRWLLELHQEMNPKYYPRPEQGDAV